jgi:hypothetical protein
VTAQERHVDTIEYVDITITGPTDLSEDAVEIAVAPLGELPAADGWLPADWVSHTPVGDLYRSVARTATPYTSTRTGVFRVLGRLTDNPETVITDSGLIVFYQ